MSIQIVHGAESHSDKITLCGKPISFHQNEHIRFSNDKRFITCQICQQGIKRVEKRREDEGGKRVFPDLSTWDPELLHGKTLKMFFSKDDGYFMLAGKCKEDGRVYILDNGRINE